MFMLIKEPAELDGPDPVVKALGQAGNAALGGQIGQGYCKFANPRARVSAEFKFAAVRNEREGDSADPVQHRSGPSSGIHEAGQGMVPGSCQNKP